MELKNSRRQLLSASYVSTILTTADFRSVDRRPSRAFEKLNFIHQFAMKQDEVQLLRRNYSEDRSFVEHLDQIHELAEAVTAKDRRSNFIDLAQKASTIPAAALIRAARELASRAPESWRPFVIDAFEREMRSSPVGRLHLERIEMFPAGIERGELLFTVPMAPKETITISHKEWSTSGEEYEKIVQDSFESYSERGVAEKTDFSMSSENETKHSNAFNFQAVASGSYGPVSMTVTTGLNSTSENRQAAKASAQRAREVTEKASSRTRQEHKVSIKLETKKGVEDSSFRTITNPSDKAVRIDFYRMMRKWRIEHYRYGLRLTFDINIPNPGARLWAKYRDLRLYDQQIREPFVFTLAPDGLTDGNWQTESSKLGTAIDPPPAEKQSLSITKLLDQDKVATEIFEWGAPEGYILQDQVKGQGTWVGAGPTPGMYLPPPSGSTVPNIQIQPGSLTNSGSFKLTTEAAGGATHMAVPVIFLPSEQIALTLSIGAVRRPEAFASWRQKAWTVLYEAALARHQQRVAKIQEMRDQLWIELNGKDTLSLRRLEREELIRQTLLWIFGPSFETDTTSTSAILKWILDHEQFDKQDEDPEFQDYHKLPQQWWSQLYNFGLVVKFLQQAVEWENLLYFLYPYFWGSDDLAREKMLFEHSDPNHRDFLRAGYARVVIPVRPGFEKDFITFLDTGIFSGSLSSPYLTIAEEIASYAKTNYAGIPPANPEQHARPLLYPQQRKTWATMEKVIAALEAHFQANGKYPATLAALPGGPFVDAWNKPFVYRLPGSGNDYDLISLGADGDEGGTETDADISAGAAASLMASWFDYTPSSGIDIQLDTKLSELA
ncbi:MAG: hypothetical protein ABS58_14010 [Mesorhizobium sp. SCN 65-20]|nr:MAG: hypothetical protein ABS58_14010 [Mesorhizobium sp. SCN 65-20]